MPTYEFLCPNGHEFERFFGKISDSRSELPCPDCGQVATRQISGGAGLVFKGSGFYLTDYGKNAHRGGASPSGEGKSDLPATGEAASAKGDPAKTEVHKAESSRAEPSKTESSKPDGAKPESSTRDTATRESSQRDASKGEASKSSAAKRDGGKRDAKRDAKRGGNKAGPRSSEG